MGVVVVVAAALVAAGREATDLRFVSVCLAIPCACAGYYKRPDYKVAYVYLENTWTPPAGNE